MSSRAIASGIAQILVVALLFVVLVRRFGAQDLGDAVRALAPATVLLSLGLGAAGALVSGWRWRVVAAGLGDRMSLSTAVLRCYEAAFLNAVLPGGLAGDAVRAVRRGRGGTAWTVSVGSVVGERLCGTAVVVGAAAVALFRLAPGTPLPWVVFAVAVLALAAAGPSLRRLPVTSVLLVLLLSLIGWAVYLALFLVAGTAVAGGADAGSLVAVCAVALGGMSVPLNVGGWGPREGAAAYAGELAGIGGGTGLVISLAYGLLALVSVLPGAVGLLVSGRQRELGADVEAQRETS